jgi:ribosome-associated protein
LTSPASESRDRAVCAAHAAASKSGSDISVLDVESIIAIIDCFVLVSATNTRMVRTIVDEVEQVLAAHDGSRPRAVEGLHDATWVLMDYGDLLVHVFLEETRAYYDLDRLWADAVRVPFEERTVATAP